MKYTHEVYLKANNELTFYFDSLTGDTYWANGNFCIKDATANLFKVHGYYLVELEEEN